MRLNFQRPCPVCSGLAGERLADLNFAVFDDEILLDGGEKRVYCTLGQFSMIRLERDTQLVIPCYDFCMPQKECISSSDDHPCELFSRIKFPVEEFFPPAPAECPTDYREAKEICCK